VPGERRVDDARDDGGFAVQTDDLADDAGSAAKCFFQKP
jgi:hypothetical protein